jgi:16S rRNA processing protein RimM
MPAKKTIRVGRIVGAHGLRGDVKVEILTDFVERLEAGQRLRLKGDWITVRGARLQKDRLILSLEGINDIDQAQALQWEYLEAYADERPELDEDEFVTADLIGMAVVTGEGEELGTVTDVLALPAHDVIVVGSIMIPAVKQFVKDVNLEARKITVELIEGMRE